MARCVPYRSTSAVPVIPLAAASQRLATSGGGKATRTIAIEAEDAAAVIAAVASVGLDGYFNTNYSSGLEALLAHVPERYAVIDVGTNSVKLHVGERDGSGSWRTIVDRAEVTRLGENLEKAGEITSEAAERTANAISDMSGEAKRSGVRAIVAVGTAGLKNRPQQCAGDRRNSSPNGCFDPGHTGRGGEPFGLPCREGRAASARWRAGSP